MNDILYEPKANHIVISVEFEFENAHLLGRVLESISNNEYFNVRQNVRHRLIT